jgi:hypothetical protein
MDMLNLLLTIIGILVSAIGLYYAIMQVKGLKKITKENVTLLTKHIP